LYRVKFFKSKIVQLLKMTNNESPLNNMKPIEGALEEIEEEEIYTKCAQAILNADFMLLGTGAGFSADSGLAVYKDIADVNAYRKLKLKYYDLCDPQLLDSNPELFFGFWGQCFNDYRTKKPHAGYEIIKSWKEILYKKYNEKLPKPFFIYTSNVDTHFHNAGFAENEIYEIHGNIEHWQCGTPCEQETYGAPKDFSFSVDQTTMLSKDDGKIPEQKSSGILWCNHPRCLNCFFYARPRILMFGDSACLSINSNGYYGWRNSVIQCINSQYIHKIVIIEIGAGNNVPSVRSNSESFVKDIYYQKNVTFIRINLDLPIIKSTVDMYCTPISIKSKGLPALLKIDEKIKMLQAKKTEAINN